MKHGSSPLIAALLIFRSAFQMKDLDIEKRWHRGASHLKGFGTGSLWHHEILIAGTRSLLTQSRRSGSTLWRIGFTAFDIG
jgi:hypothetical protein